MEITDVEAIAVAMNVRSLEEGGIAPYVTNHNEVQRMNRILVRVDTDEKLSGWGEMRVFLTPGVTTNIIEDGIGPVLKGMSPYEVESFRRQQFVEYTNLDFFFSAVEIACWDIIGKAEGKPLNELLGGLASPSQTARRTDQKYDNDTRYVDTAYCLGILPPEQSAKHAKQAHRQGFEVLKTKGGRSWQQDVERIKAMHEATNGDVDFRLDPNQGWRPDEAVRLAATLEDAGIYLQYIEQPIRVDSHHSLGALRQRTAQPIAANEDTYIPRNLRMMIQRGAIDAAVLDMTPAGGISGLRQMAAIAEDAGIPMAHHCAFDLGIRTAAILHAVTGIPGFSLAPDTVYYAWEDDVITEPFRIKEGALPVPTEPGLGVEVDQSKVDQYRLDT